MPNELIPANIITGFLGVGKTTAINYLLKNKPANERWAVLVNEFGELGIDQELLLQADGVYVKEVPGGCICCLAGLPMQIGLTLLLKQAKPHRLLIEPTGLGHPLQILASLLKAPFNESLSIQATLCLVDARVVDQTQVLANDTFQDQLQLADVIVANKCDLPSEAQLLQFRHFAEQFLQPEHAVRKYFEVVQAQLDPAWLEFPRYPHQAFFPLAHSQVTKESMPQFQPDWRLPGVTVHLGAGFGVQTASFSFSPQWRFDGFQLVATLRALTGVWRIKGVFEVQDGWLAFNAVNDEVSLTAIEPRTESRLELIAPQLNWELVEQAIYLCLLAR